MLGLGLGLWQLGANRNLVSPSGVAAGLFLDTRSNTAFVSGAPSSLAAILNVVRATTAMDEYADGSVVSVGTNVARYGGGRGLLIERTATNICLQSQTIDSATWVTNQTKTADQILAPDGTLTADMLTVAAIANQTAYQNVSCTASTQYTFSWYVRLGTLAPSDYRTAIYDVTGAAFIVPINSVPSVTPTAAGWVRCTQTFTTPVGCVTVRPYIYGNSASNVAGTYYIWGAQLETGPLATSYIPTSTVAVTRNADQIKITGAPLTAGIGAGTAFTIFAEYEAVVSVDASYVWGVANDAAPSSGDVAYSSVSTSRTGQGIINSVGMNQFTNATAALNVPPTLNRVAMRVAADDAAISHNGAAVITDVSITMPAATLDRIVLGSSPGAIGGQALNGRITRFAAWPSLLSNADLQGIL